MLDANPQLFNYMKKKIFRFELVQLRQIDHDWASKVHTFQGKTVDIT